MSKTFTSPYIQAVRNLFASITSANTTTPVQVCDASSISAGANDSVIKSLSIVSTSTSAVVVGIFVDPSGTGTKHLIGCITVPVTAGTDGVAIAVDVLRSPLLPQLQYDAYLNKVLCLQAGAKLYVGAMTTMTSGTLTVLAECGDM